MAATNQLRFEGEEKADFCAYLKALRDRIRDRGYQNLDVDFDLYRFL